MTLVQIQVNFHLTLNSNFFVTPPSHVPDLFIIYLFDMASLRFLVFHERASSNLSIHFHKY